MRRRPASAQRFLQARQRIGLVAATLAASLAFVAMSPVAANAATGTVSIDSVSVARNASNNQFEATASVTVSDFEGADAVCPRSDCSVRLIAHTTAGRPLLLAARGSLYGHGSPYTLTISGSSEAPPIANVTAMIVGNKMGSMCIIFLAQMVYMRELDE